MRDNDNMQLGQPANLSYTARHMEMSNCRTLVDAAQIEQLST